MKPIKQMCATVLLVGSVQALGLGLDWQKDVVPQAEGSVATDHQAAPAVGTGVAQNTAPAQPSLPIDGPSGDVAQFLRLRDAQRFMDQAEQHISLRIEKSKPIVGEKAQPACEPNGQIEPGGSMYCGGSIPVYGPAENYVVLRYNYCHDGDVLGPDGYWKDCASGAMDKRLPLIADTINHQVLWGQEVVATIRGSKVQLTNGYRIAVEKKMTVEQEERLEYPNCRVVDGNWVGDCNTAVHTGRFDDRYHVIVALSLTK